MKSVAPLKAILCFIILTGIGFSAVKGPKYYDLRSMGMGNTTVAVTTDRTAIFHNPAGLSLLKDKIDVSISPLMMGIDGKFGTIVRAMAEQGDKLSDLAEIDQDFMDMLSDVDGEWVGLEYTPEITVAAKNLGFGIYSNFPIGMRIESGHLIPKLGLRGQRDLVFTWAVGVPLRTDKIHCGVSVEYLQRTPLDETILSYSQTFNYFDQITGGSVLGVVGDFAEVQHGVSFDVGFMHNLKGFRIAYGIQDILGVVGGKMVLPPQIDAGCAYYFPQVEKTEFIDNLIVSVEMSDIFGVEPVTEKYEHPVKKLHFGAELDMHYAAIRLGLNQGYPTAGLGLRFGVFSLDYVYFTEELGYYPGQFPRTKHILALSARFKTPKPKREQVFEEEELFIEDEETPRQKQEMSPAVEEEAGAPVPEQAEQPEEQKPVVNDAIEQKSVETPKQENIPEPQQPVQEKTPVQENKDDETDWE